MKRFTSSRGAAAALAGAVALGLGNQAAASGAETEKKPVVEFSSCAKPAWPEADQKAQHTGTVTLSFEVDANGKVTDSAIVKSSGHAGLDEAARSGIAKCRFSNGPGKTQLKYVWTLE